MSDAPQSQGNAGALAGVRVLDLTRVLAGPLAAMTLGDMGAEVIKVEPQAGDDTRAWGPPFALDPAAQHEDGYRGEAAYFLGVNRNKRSMQLNMAVPAGQKVLAELIKRADVLIDNFKLGTLARWGFDDEWIQANAPRVVHCAITGYGSTGPKADLPGYDFILQAESGLMSICGEVDGEPTKYGVAIVDIVTGLYASNAILGALQARHRTGLGQKVEVSLLESSLSMLANVASNHLVTGREARRFGNGHPNIVPYTSYQAADGMIALAVGNDGQFAKFAEVVGRPEWARDPKFTRNSERIANRDALDAAITTILKTRTRDDWVTRLRAAGVPCGRINTVGEALADGQATAREMVVEVDHPSAGTVKLLGIPFKMKGTPASVRRAPPRLGEHTDEVLAELGLDAARIAALRAAKII